MAPLESAVNSNKITIKLFLVVVLVGLVITGSVFTGEKFHIDPKVLQKVQEKYGQEARARLVAWEELLKHDGVTDREKLEKVNSFFNKKIVFASDMNVYGVDDYWATPIESLSHGAGDCEDQNEGFERNVRRGGVSHRVRHGPKNGHRSRRLKNHREARKLK